MSILEYVNKFEVGSCSGCSDVDRVDWWDWLETRHCFPEFIIELLARRFWSQERLVWQNQRGTIDSICRRS